MLAKVFPNTRRFTRSNCPFASSSSHPQCSNVYGQMFDNVLLIMRQETWEGQPASWQLLLLMMLVRYVLWQAPQSMPPLHSPPSSYSSHAPKRCPHSCARTFAESSVYILVYVILLYAF